MIDLEQLQRRLRFWLQTPRHDLTGRERTLRWWVDLARYGAHKLHEDRASQMAAALTYHTLFSLLPTVVMALVVLQAFVGIEQREQFKQSVVDWVLSPIQAESVSEVGTPEIGPREEFQDARRELSQRVEEILGNLENVDFGSLGIAGILLFLYATTGLLSTVERSFNTVYGGARGRGLHVRLPIYYTVVTVGPLLLLGGQVLQRRLWQTLEMGGAGGWLLGIVAVLTPVLAAWVVLGLMYALLPNASVRIDSAAVGSFMAACLWVIAFQLFSIYVQRAAVSTLYGALGLLPLSLLWIWLSWLIVLFGLEIAHALQAMREGQALAYGDERSGVLVDRMLLLPMAALVAERFREGRLTTVSDLTHHLFLREKVVVAMLDALQEARLVHHIAEREGQGFSLARPPEEIRASEVLAAGDLLLPRGSRTLRGRMKAFMGHLQESLEQGSAGTTLAELSGPVENTR